jgi:hypothetical protein
MMFIMSDDPKVPTADWVATLQREMSDATTLLWEIQNALTEAQDLTPEIVKLTAGLGYRLGVISGHVSRWEEYQKTSRAGFDRHCRHHADSTYVRRDNGTTVALSELSAASSSGSMPVGASPGSAEMAEQFYGFKELPFAAQRELLQKMFSSFMVESSEITGLSVKNAGANAPPRATTRRTINSGQELRINLRRKAA